MLLFAGEEATDEVDEEGEKVWKVVNRVAYLVHDGYVEIANLKISREFFGVAFSQKEVFITGWIK